MSETSLKNDSNLGPLVIVRAKTLAEAGTTGTVAEGIYEGAVAKPAGIAKSGKKYGASTEYRIRDTKTDTLYILNETKALKDQLSQLNAEDNVNIRVQYNGKVATKAGVDYHDFEVFVVGA